MMNQTKIKKTLNNKSEQKEKHQERKTKKQILNSTLDIEWNKQLKDFYAKQ